MSRVAVMFGLDERQYGRVAKGKPKSLQANLFNAAMSYMETLAFDLKSKARNWVFERPDVKANLSMVSISFVQRRNSDVGGAVSLTWNPDRGVAVRVMMDSKADKTRYDQREFTAEPSETTKETMRSVMSLLDDMAEYVGGG